MSTETTLRVYTMGHSNMALHRLLALLVSHEISVLVDVRSTPYSRQNPQYNREPLAEALEKHPAVFSDLYVNMIAAGEAGGILDTILQRLSTYIEKIVKLRSAIRSALVYPVAVILIAIGVEKRRPGTTVIKSDRAIRVHLQPSVGGRRSNRYVVATFVRTRRGALVRHRAR